MTPIEKLWRLRVFKRGGTWRIRIAVDGEPWGEIPTLFPSYAEALTVVRELAGGVSC